MGSVVLIIIFSHPEQRNIVYSNVLMVVLDSHENQICPLPNYSTSAGRDSFGPIQLPGSGQEPSKGCDRSPWQSCNWAPLIIASLGQAGVASGRWWQASYLNVQFKFTT